MTKYIWDFFPQRVHHKIYLSRTRCPSRLQDSFCLFVCFPGSYTLNLQCNSNRNEFTYYQNRLKSLLRRSLFKPVESMFYTTVCDMNFWGIFKMLISCGGWRGEGEHYVVLLSKCSRCTNSPGDQNIIFFCSKTEVFKLSLFPWWHMAGFQ